MGTLKRTYNGRRKAPRTRSGCITCRKRKLKCDENKPSCCRCRANGTPCVYGLTLTWPEAETRRTIKRPSPSYANVAYGQRASKSKSTQSTTGSVTQHPFLNTTFADFEILLYDKANSTAPEEDDLTSSYEDDNVQLFVEPSSVSGQVIYNETIQDLPLLRFSHSLSISSADQRLFGFYARRMCPKCPLVDQFNNTYRAVIIPLSLQSPLLLQSVLAAAANQLKFYDTQYTVTALQYRGAALRSLIRALPPNVEPHLQLQHNRQSSFPLSRTELLGVVLLLCMYDLSTSQPCKAGLSTIRDQGWWSHLMGAQKIMQLPDDSAGGEKISSMLAQYLSTYSILAYTTVVDDEEEKLILQGASYWLTQIARPGEEIQCFSGCSNELLGILLDVCANVRAWKKKSADRDHNFNLDKLREWKKETEERLFCLVQRTPAELALRCDDETGQTGHENPPTTADDVNDMVGSESVWEEGEDEEEERQKETKTKSDAPGRTAECVRLAVLILLQHLDIDDVDVDDNPLISESVASIFRLMEKGTYLPAEGKSGQSSYLWPHFIAACHVETDRDRTFLLRQFDQMHQPGAMISKIVLEPIRETVELVWKRQDLKRHAYYTSDGRGRGQTTQSCFDWEDVMRAQNYRLNWL